MKSIDLGRSVKIDAYKVIARAVEEGVRFGYNRAYKYTENPSPDALISSIETEVMSALGDVLMFTEESETEK